MYLYIVHNAIYYYIWNITSTLKYSKDNYFFERQNLEILRGNGKFVKKAFILFFRVALERKFPEFDEYQLAKYNKKPKVKI